MPRVVARHVGSLALPFLLLTALATPGCGTNWTPPAPSTGEDVPLAVWLPSGLDIASTPYTVFHVNRPAHVAIFDIHPGEGVRAVHPRGPGSNQRLRSSGYHALLGANPVSSQARCHRLGTSPVVYRFIVASSEPLRTEELRGDVSFRHVPGMRTRFFATNSPMRTMEAIVDRALPRAAEADEWAAFYSPYWLSPCGPTVQTRLTRALTLEAAHDDGADEPIQGEDGEDARDIPGIAPPEQPGDLEVRPPVTEESALVIPGRLGEAAGVSERVRTPDRVGPYEKVRHLVPVPASHDAGRAGNRSHRTPGARDSRPRVQRPDRVRTPRVERPRRDRSGSADSRGSERAKKPSSPEKDGDG